MSKKYIEFNDVTFGGENWVLKQGNAQNTYTPYIITEFYPNEVNTAYQQDDYITDGALFSNFRYEARIVSLRGYILPRKGEDVKVLRQALYTKLNGKKQTKLVYYDGNKRYFCNAFADTPVCAKELKNTVEFNINFTIPDFFWLEYELTTATVASRENLIKTPFTMPMIFAQRISTATVQNEQEFEIFPKFIIIANNISAAGVIYILNHTTGEQIVISDLNVENGSEITIDCKQLTASVNGIDIINNCNDFSGFSLIPGNNLLECVDNNEGRNSIVCVKYYRQFVGI